MDLGKLRIEYQKDSDVIQVFNSPQVCSLVINGEIADSYSGVVASRFMLRGTVKHEKDEITVIASMGHLFMRLYYADTCVAKKFMGLG